MNRTGNQFALDIFFPNMYINKMYIRYLDVFLSICLFPNSSKRTELIKLEEKIPLRFTYYEGFRCRLGSLENVKKEKARVESEI